MDFWSEMEQLPASVLRNGLYNREPPYTPTTWPLGQFPNKKTDVPTMAVFIVLFIIVGVGHGVILVGNGFRGNKVFLSAVMLAFCTDRIAALGLRIGSAVDGMNGGLYIASFTLVFTGQLFTNFAALVLTRRVIRAQHPKHGNSVIVTGFFGLLYGLLVIATGISAGGLVKQFWRKDRSQEWDPERKLRAGGFTLYAILAPLPIPLALLSTALPRSRHGRSSWGKYWLLTLISLLLTIEAIFIAGTEYINPTQRQFKAPDYTAKAWYYSVIWALEIIVVFLFAVARGDSRFDDKNHRHHRQLHHRRSNHQYRESQWNSGPEPAPLVAGGYYPSAPPVVGPPPGYYGGYGTGHGVQQDTHNFTRKARPKVRNRLSKLMSGRSQIDQAMAGSNSARKAVAAAASVLRSGIADGDGFRRDTRAVQQEGGAGVSTVPRPPSPSLSVKTKPKRGSTASAYKPLGAHPLRRLSERGTQSRRWSARNRLIINTRDPIPGQGQADIEKKRTTLLLERSMARSSSDSDLLMSPDELREPVRRSLHVVGGVVSPLEPSDTLSSSGSERTIELSCSVDSGKTSQGSDSKTSETLVSAKRELSTNAGPRASKFLEHVFMEQHRPIPRKNARTLDRELEKDMMRYGIKV